MSGEQTTPVKVTDIHSALGRYHSFCLYYVINAWYGSRWCDWSMPSTFTDEGQGSGVFDGSHPVKVRFSTSNRFETLGNAHTANCLNWEKLRLKVRLTCSSFWPEYSILNHSTATNSWLENLSPDFYSERADLNALNTTSIWRDKRWYGRQLASIKTVCCCYWCLMSIRVVKAYLLFDCSSCDISWEITGSRCTGHHYHPIDLYLNGYSSSYFV